MYKIYSRFSGQLKNCFTTHKHTWIYCENEPKREKERKLNPIDKKIEKCWLLAVQIKKMEDLVDSGAVVVVVVVVVVELGSSFYVAVEYVCDRNRKW